MPFAECIVARARARAGRTFLEFLACARLWFPDPTRQMPHLFRKTPTTSPARGPWFGTRRPSSSPAISCAYRVPGTLFRSAMDLSRPEVVMVVPPPRTASFAVSVQARVSSA